MDFDLDARPARSSRIAHAVVPATPSEAASSSVYGSVKQRTDAQHKALTAHMRMCKVVMKGHQDALKERPGPSSSNEASELAWQLRAASSSLVSITSIAREVQRDRKDVRAALSSVAWAWTQAQWDLLAGVQQRISSESIRLDYFLDHLKWDETRQTLCLQFSRTLHRDDCKAAWQVMQSLRILEWRETGASRSRRLRLAMPPVVLVGVVSADAFQDSLFGVAYAREVNRFIEFMRGRCALGIASRECDDDSKNRKLNTP